MSGLKKICRQGLKKKCRQKTEAIFFQTLGVPTNNNRQISSHLTRQQKTRRQQHTLFHHILVTMSSGGNPAEQEEGQAMALVSEFPPVPFYYRLAGQGKLPPPAIPIEALARGTARAAAQAARARAESERLRLGEQDTTDAILGGVAAPEEQDDGDVVAVFGEIVEDPMLIEPLDRCEDPKIVRDEVKRLNQEVVKGFINLVSDLVHNPMENK